RMEIRLITRPADEKRTFGYRRFEILAAAFNAVLLFVVAGYVLYEGIKRILDPEPVGSIGMLIVAAAGLVINLISMRILSSGKDRSLNVKGAYLEVWADMLGSLGVLVAAVVITVTDWRWVDPIVAIAIGLWVLPRTWILLRDTTHILLEGAPRGVALSDVRVAILATPGVASLHDLHVWVSGADQASCTVHVVLAEGADADAVRQAVGDMLEERFDLHHTTVQTELEPCGDAGGLHV
ncbi:cation diffusion facilitator family transporter, partial [Brevundimonas sp.]|uniref:cation diffusion facilitator family transporter n=1 Tax=Brevundimonas sp. TaxID=1871086 RepID=UPI00199A1AE3